MQQGSFQIAEVCELVGVLILYELENENIFQQNKFGINRDDGLAIVESKLGPIIVSFQKNSERCLTDLT